MSWRAQRLGDDGPRGDPLANLRMGVQIHVLRDPRHVIDQVENILAPGGRPTGWMQRHRTRATVAVSDAGRAHTYAGRACCYEHLKMFDGRSDIQLPFDTTCPGCAREFRFQYGPMSAGGQK